MTEGELVIITVIHHRLRSAWGGPFGCDPDICKVAYSGDYSLKKKLRVTDDNRLASITVRKEEHRSIEFIFRLYYKGIRIHTTKMPLKTDKYAFTTYQEPLCDAMESWDFYFTDADVQPDILLSGYRRLSDVLFISMKDEELNREYRKDFFNRSDI